MKNLTIAGAMVVSGVDNSRMLVVNEGGKGKAKFGTIAKLVMVGNKASREAYGAGLYAEQMQNGQYKPFVRDLLQSPIFTKQVREALDYIASAGGESVTKEKLVAMCRLADHTIRNKLADNKSVKGEALKYYSIVQAVLTAADSVETVEEVVSEE